jgi:hypothetical protein
MTRGIIHDSVSFCFTHVGMTCQVFLSPVGFGFNDDPGYDTAIPFPHQPTTDQIAGNVTDIAIIECLRQDRFIDDHSIFE